MIFGARERGGLPWRKGYRPSSMVPDGFLSQCPQVAQLVAAQELQLLPVPATERVAPPSPLLTAAKRDRARRVFIPSH